jgi:DNA repair protein RecO
VKTENTKGIVLTRINYSESDRIITVLTDKFGKLRLMVRGARKIKSKMAGGIELFSTIELSFIPAKAEIGTLVSARLINHYGNIIKDINRVQLGYEILKLINKSTEDNSDEAYFDLLGITLSLIDNHEIGSDRIRFWFDAQLLKIAGHTPNLITDENNQPLKKGSKYLFDSERMCFIEAENGRLGENDIKYMRLLFAEPTNLSLFNLNRVETVEAATRPLVEAMFRTYI